MLPLTESLVLGLVMGALGGHFLAYHLPRYGLGLVGTTVAGAAGGAILSELLFRAIPLVQNGGPSLNFAGALAHIVVGAVGGMLLTLVIGQLKPRRSGSAA